MHPDFPTVVGEPFYRAAMAVLSKHISSRDIWADLEKNLIQREKLDPRSYTTQKHYVTENSPKLLPLMALHIMDPSGKMAREERLFFAMTDAIYRGRPPEEVALFWQLSRKNTKHLVKVIQAYVSMNMASLSIQSGRILADKFKEFVNQGATENLISKLVDDSDLHVKPLWASFFRGLAQLEDYCRKEIENKTQEKVTDELKNFYRQIQLNVKYLVTYPNMLMLAYFSKKTNYNETFDAFGITYRVNANVVINDTLLGRLPPFFILTTDVDAYKGISEPEVMLAVYYAHVTGLFELYGIDRENWLSTIYESQSRMSLEFMRSAKAKILSSFLRPEAPAQSFLRVCQELKQGQPRELLLRNLSDLRAAIVYGDFAPERAAPPMGPTLNAIVPNHFSSDLEEAMEVLRSDYAPGMRRVQLVRHLLELPLAGAIAEQVKEMEDIANFLYSVVGDMEQAVGDCALRLAELERDRRDELISDEIQHLRHVHLLLRALNDFQSFENESVAQLRARQHDIWQDPFFKDLAPDKPLFVAAKELIHRELHLSEIFSQNSEYGKDYALSAGLQRAAGGGYYYRVRTMDLILRFWNYYQYGYAGKKQAARPPGLRYTLPDSMLALRNSIGMLNPNSEVDAEVLRPSTGDPDVFFRQTLWLYSPFLWFKDGPTSQTNTMTKWIKLMVSILKAKSEGNTQATDIAKCDAACEREERAKAHSGIEVVLKRCVQFIEHLSMTPTDQLFVRNILLKSTLFTSAAGEGPNGLFIYGIDNNYYISVADQAYLFTVSHLLGGRTIMRPYRSMDKPASGAPGETGNSEVTPEMLLQVARTSPFAKGEEQAEFFRDMDKRILFSAGTELPEALRQLYGYQIKRELMLEDVFTGVVSELAQKPYTLKRPVQFSTSYAPLQQIYFLSYADKYRTENEIYNQKTYNIYRYIPPKD